MKHEWNKSQIKALKSSILHWERMRDDKRRNVNGELEYPGEDHCACCKKFSKPIDGVFTCYKCPIKLYTNKTKCDGTPYMDAWNYFHCQEFKSSSQKMINFMNKVLKAGIPVDHKGEKA